jgi:hypothetical protein
LNSTTSATHGMEPDIIQYIQRTVQSKSGTWLTGGRLARASALQQNWPKVMSRWHPTADANPAPVLDKSQPAATTNVASSAGNVTAALGYAFLATRITRVHLHGTMVCGNDPRRTHNGLT